VQTNGKIDETYPWKCQWRGEERCERYSHRKSMMGGPEKESFWKSNQWK